MEQHELFCVLNIFCCVKILLLFDNIYPISVARAVVKRNIGMVQLFAVFLHCVCFWRKKSIMLIKILGKYFLDSQMLRAPLFNHSYILCLILIFTGSPKILFHLMKKSGDRLISGLEIKDALWWDLGSLVFPCTATAASLATKYSFSWNTFGVLETFYPELHWGQS